MHSISILAVIFGLIIAIMTILCGTLLMAIRLKGSVSKKNQKHNADEAATIQELHKGLARMEERTEALETLLLDRSGKEHKK